MRIITGFHAIEEILRAVQEGASAECYDRKRLKILYAKEGPRVKKILAQARSLAITTECAPRERLQQLVGSLPDYLQDHRGVVLVDESDSQKADYTHADAVLAELYTREKAVAVVLDSITDPHNIGAIIRSADQFAVDAVVIPERHSAGGFQTISKSSSGAVAWVPLVYTANLVRTVEQLKAHGFWVFGADAGGTSLPEITFPEKVVLIMGSEGAGIGRLLRKACDFLVSIPTSGKLDSLNVSVAAGILMYEINKKC
ncbi:MAG: 23S rRNA (guanosine(2251)-2'-O)-methyltransferase RlmB [Treponema sp.]